VSFEAELRGMTQPLSQRIGRIYTAACQANFGDNKCKFNTNSITDNLIVTSLIDDRKFGSSSTNQDNFYNGGILTWTTGKNKNIKIEVKGSLLSLGTIELHQKMIYEIQLGDSFKIYRGCDKSIETCKNTFNNVVNFRGFPHVPGRDKLFGKN
jgi:uncharacterized phage protein (TIGR02218 family)